MHLMNKIGGQPPPSHLGTKTRYIPRWPHLSHLGSTTRDIPHRDRQKATQWVLHTLLASDSKAERTEHPRNQNEKRGRKREGS